MYRFTFIIEDILLILPALLSIVILLGVLYFRSFKKTALYIVFTLYLAAIFSAVGFPSIRSHPLDITINCVPLVGISADLTNALLNVLLFIPLGIMLPLFWEKFRSFRNALLFALALTVLIEIAQIFTFRTSDIDDLITNLAGAVIGYLIVLPFTRRKGALLPGASWFDALLLCGVVMAEMFFLQPFLSDLMYPIVDPLFHVAR